MSTFTGTVEGKEIVVDLDVDDGSEGYAVVTIDVAGERVAEITEAIPECMEEHCSEHRPGERSVAAEAIAEAYARVAPENERACDWWRTMAEPWRSIADALGVR